MLTCHVFIASSLDGFIARDDGDIEWLLSRDDPSEDHGYNHFINEMDGIIMGRGTFEKVLSFSPWPYTKAVVVLSRSFDASGLPENLQSKVRILNLSPQAAIKQLTSEGWRKAYVDGGQLIQSFLRESLIDDLTITTIPVLIGQGRPLFGQLKEDVSLSLVDSKKFPSGLVQSRYRVTR